MKKLLQFLLLLLMALPIEAQIRGNDIVVSVTPDHKDWNYKLNETANFEVNVRKSGTLLDNVQIDYEAGPVMYPDVKRSITLKDGTLHLKGTLNRQGFYRVKVVAHVNGKDYEGLCTAGFAPEKIQPYAKCPDDFDDFWKKALEEARRNLLPDRCTKDDNVYEVSFVNNRPNSRIYGILSVPKAQGHYPALLRVPGAGVRPYPGDTYTASGKCIVLEIGIHGIPVTLDQTVYDRLLDGALNGYWDTNLEDPNKNYYKRVITGAVRSVDFIASLPEWDGKTLGVTGASQGGFLSIATAALDSRVTFFAAIHDAMCDYEAETKGIAGGWPHYFYNQKADVKRIEGSRYYDGVNFAKRLRPSQVCWFSFGYNDEVVPPTSSYGLYNIVKAKKSLTVYPMTGHYWYQEQWDEWQNFLIHQLGY